MKSDGGSSSVYWCKRPKVKSTRMLPAPPPTFLAGFEDAAAHAHPGQGRNSDFWACGCAGHLPHVIPEP